MLLLFGAIDRTRRERGDNEKEHTIYSLRTAKVDQIAIVLFATTANNESVSPNGCTEVTNYYHYTKPP